MRRTAEGRIEELTPAPFNLRSRVNEYGGRPFTAGTGVVVGVGFADQRIWRFEHGAPPEPLTPESEGWLRYADLVLDLGRHRVLAVREDHRGEGGPAHALVAIPLSGGPRGYSRVAENGLLTLQRWGPFGSMAL